MTSAEKFRAAARVFDIKIDSYIEQDPVGRLRTEGRAGELPFHGALQLVLLIDDALSRESCPDECDHWAQPPDPAALREGVPAKAATLELELLFRENNSWQGRMTWLEENKKTTFRSVLELLRVMDEALNE